MSGGGGSCPRTITNMISYSHWSHIFAGGGGGQCQVLNCGAFKLFSTS